MRRDALAGMTVLVTRPPGQAEALCELIRDRGGRAWAWPAIRIVAVDADEKVLRAPLTPNPPDWIVFVSRNAVRHGLSLLPASTNSRIAAIGPATARALADGGVGVDLVAERPDSEGLLAAAALRDVAGRHVVIVRGVGGRETLAETLRARGARVDYEEVYRRVRPQPGPERLAELLAAWRRDAIDVYTATSVEILDNLVAMLGPEGRPLVTVTPLVTASARVVQQAGRIGHRGARLLASRPDDGSLVEAIVAWRTGSSAAS